MDESCKDTIFKYCPRCVVRILCIQWSVIGKSELEIKKHLSKKYGENLENWFLNKGENLPEDQYTDVCKACLGILQDKFVEECVDSVVCSINNDCYVFDSFQTYFILPVQLLVTDHIAVENVKRLNLTKNVSCDIKEVLKFLVEPKLSKQLNCERSTDGVLEISINVEHVQTELEILPTLKGKSPNSFKSNSSAYKKRVKLTNEKEYTIAQVKNAIENIKFESLKDVCENILKMSIVKNIKLFRVPVYIGGRYNKYSRDLPQTPWFVDGERKKESSVEEYITGLIKKYFYADNHNFSSSGREDVDVRMLGNGRPFLVELMNSRKSSLSNDEMIKLQTEINGQTKEVAVSNLKVVTKADCKKLKEGEEEKTKSYLAMCYFINTPTLENLEKLDNLSKITDLVIKQKTPIRVLHRRPLAIRPRTIHSMMANSSYNSAQLKYKCDNSIDEKLNLKDGGNVNEIGNFDVSELEFANDKRCFALELNTQAGTYIKEFVHGDFGRTTPTLGDLLGGEVDILTLDVKSVNVKWPPM